MEGSHTNITDEDSIWTNLPNELWEVIEEFQNILINELSIEFTSKKTVDHKIEVILGFESSTKAPYRFN